MQDTFERDEFKGFADFVKQDTVYKHRRSEYLPEDTLTACCRMQCVETDIIYPILCDATSVIGVERSSFNWTIEYFSSIQNGDKRMMLVHTDSKGKSSFTLILYLMDDPEGEIQIEISHNYMDQPNMTNCEICVMDDSNNIIHSKKDSRYLEGKVWIFPSFITKSKLMADEDTCLIKDELNLKFDISVSLDVTYNEINAYGRYFPEDIGSSSNSDEDCLSSKNSESEHSDTADLRVFEIYLDELMCWYQDGTFSDIILKVGKRKFSSS
ncbi:BTB domain-containing protein [Caerostris extrusa]|uniref:BTB domain-containing protein n=1 Tax=Caerostris extrusa TaxID=172846 RepID=A0AAV4UKD5_CAEEX|nr:BTB domain-containing protein [Caerostris extrusa]